MDSTGTRLYVVLLISCTCQLIPLTTGREFVPSAEVNNMFQNFRKMAFRAIEGSRGKKDLGKHNPKFQEPVPLSTDFPCPTNPGSPGARSSTRPTSVHQLRPGDIDVIGALGDSILAGMGAASINVMEVYLENRGFSFAIGGEGTWREYLTLPNILKEFNPNLVGYSLGTALGFMKSSKLNIAEPMAMNRDMLFQAKLLILRMKDNPRIDFKEDWKLVTIMMGHNDFCSDMCYRNWTKLPNNTRQDLQNVLQFLHENMPRALINLVPPFNVAEVRSYTNVSTACELLRPVECSCIFGQKFHDRLHEFVSIIKESQNVYLEFVNNSLYNDKDDFAVVVQPFLLDAVFPTKTEFNETVPDSTVYAQDCFHLSQKGHAYGAQSLWNNMMEPAGNKSLVLAREILTPFPCPSEKHPYIYTAMNSDDDDDDDDDDE